ncbi:hypothetical protein BJX70DRAFT_408835 [Aspergillus crustosus]
MASITPAYANETRGPRILGLFWTFFSVSVIMVSARLYIRARWLKNIGLDDYIIAVSMVMLTGYTIITTVNVGLGYGKHTSVIMQQNGMDRLVDVLLINYVDFSFGIMAFTTPKLAIAALLNRILNPGRLHRIWLWVLTGLVFVSSSICIIILFTMCNPPAALWTPELMSAGAVCRPTSVLVSYAIFTGAVSGFADLYLAIYPTVILMQLQITLTKKVALCAALGLGAVACAMAIVKCFQLPSLYDTSDSTYATADLVIWTSIESNMIIIASCIPTLGPLYELFRGKRSWSSHKRYGKTSANQIPSTTGDRQFKKPTFGSHKEDELFTTNIGVTNNGSQESILGADRGHKESQSVNQIQRTDQVVVEYELRDMGPEGRPSW